MAPKTHQRTREQRIDTAVATAYQHQVRKYGEWAHLSHVCDDVLRISEEHRLDISYDELIACLSRFARSGYAQFAPMKNPRTIDKQAAVKVNGRRCHLIAIGGAR